MRVAIIAVTALLCVACAQQDRQAAPMSSDVGSVSAVPTATAESQDAAGAGEALLKFADNLSALINIYDMRQHFVVLEAAVLKAVEQAKIAFNAIEGAVGNLVTSDQTYQRQHRLGISFL